MELRRCAHFTLNHQATVNTRPVAPGARSVCGARLAAISNKDAPARGTVDVTGLHGTVCRHMAIALLFNLRHGER